MMGTFTRSAGLGFLALAVMSVQGGLAGLSGQAAVVASDAQVRFTPDSLALRAPGGMDAYPRSWIAGPRVRRVEGPDWKVAAGVGALLGAAGTYVWLNSGGSTSHCDRSRNQDAMSRGACLGLTTLGGAVGAGIGVLAARLLRSEHGGEEHRP